MSDFKREERYIVVKLKDIGAEEAEALRGFLRSWKIPTRECVVVEPHWPNYADTWKAVEQVAKGEYQSPHYKIEQLQQQIAELEQRNNELSATVERLRLAMMAAICVMPSGEAKADLRDAYDATPQQNLNAIKREVLLGLLSTMTCGECTCDRYVEHYANHHYPDKE